MQLRSNESSRTLDETDAGTRRKIRAPNRKPGLRLPLRVYRSLKVFENRKDLEIRKLIIAVIEEFPVLWDNRKARAYRSDWEWMAIDLYLSTEVLLSVEHIREVFNEAKEKLRRELLFCKIKKFTPRETELHLNQWDLYQQIKFFREAMLEHNIDVNVENVFEDELLPDIPGDDGEPGFFNPVQPHSGPLIFDMDSQEEMLEYDDFDIGVENVSGDGILPNNSGDDGEPGFLNPIQPQSGPLDPLLHGFVAEEIVYATDAQNDETMVRRSSRLNSSQVAGTSSSVGQKKEEKKKTIAVKKVSNTKKTAIAKPPKPAPKAPKPAPPPVIYTAADVRRLKAEVEKRLREEAEHKEKKEKLFKEQTKKIEKLEELNKAKKEEEDDADDKFDMEEGEARKKKTALERKSEKFEEKVVDQKSLQQTRALSAHFLERFEALENWQANDGAAPPFQQCEMCQVPWSQVGDSVPRVLDCGHTMCDKCTKKFEIEDNYIKCPFDKKKTYGAGTIPKNYTLLKM